MNREMKFRVFFYDGSDFTVGEMSSAHEASREGYIEFNENGILSGINECSIIMQCTGLKDKNGTDIYEGNIVNYQNLTEYLFKVDMAELDFISPMSDEASDLDMSPGRFHQRPSQFEVIGTIYENPELIDGN